jgi:hypothetical protein
VVVEATEDAVRVDAEAIGDGRNVDRHHDLRAPALHRLLIASEVATVPVVDLSQKLEIGTQSLHFPFFRSSRATSEAENSASGIVQGA